MLPAFEAVSGPVSIQTAPDFTLTEPKPRFLGEPEIILLVRIRVQTFPNELELD